MRTKVLRVVEGMKTFLHQALDNREKYLTKQTAFIRNRVLNFSTVCLFLINQPKRSLSIELDDFFLTLGEFACTKAAFSKARYQIAPVFFKDWSRHFISLVYAAPTKLPTWKGFYLKGVDGTTVYLFKDEELAKEFGSQQNQHVSIPMARAGYEVDLLNGYCTQAYLGPLHKGEQVFAYEFLENASCKDLLVYDRYFASFELIFKHLQKGVPFVMRCTLDFNLTVSAFVKGKKRQQIVEFAIPDNALRSLRQQGFEVDKNTTVQVRLLRIDIGLPEPEILITSLLCARRYLHKEFKELYGKRWGSETEFDKVKNKLQMEIFCGHKPAAIYQDFFATVIAVNLHNLIVRTCDEDLKQANEKRLVPRAINQNVSIGLLKDRLVILFVSEKTQIIMEELRRLFLSHLEPVRPGRKFPRTKTIRRLNGKYQTFKNYRRAI